MPQENNSLAQITEKLKQSLESQAQVIDSAVSSVVEGVQSDNSKFVDELDIIKGNILGAISVQTQGGKLSGLTIDKEIGLSQLLGDTSKLDPLNAILGLKFLKVKRNILKSVDSETQGGELTGLDIDKKISLSDLLGESPNLNIIHALRWLRIKKNILKKVEGATEDVELELDSKMSLNDVLGSTPDQDILTRTRFFLIRQGLLKRISKAAKDFDPQQSVDEITGGLGGGVTTNTNTSSLVSSGDTNTNTSSLVSSGDTNTSSLVSSGDTNTNTSSSLVSSGDTISSSIDGGASVEILRAISNSIVELWSDISEPIQGTFSVLSEMRDASLGDALQDRENRKEDLALQRKQIQAMNTVAGNSEDSSDEKGGDKKGILGSITGAFKNKIGGKAAGAGAGGGIGGAMAGIGKGAGKGISGFLKGLGKGLKAISNPKYLIGAGVLIALGGALFVTGKALQTFVNIDWKNVLYGLGVLTALGVGAALLGKLGPQILIGSLAIAALGAALIPAGIAFGMFSDIDWKGVGIGIGVLTALGVAAFGLSFISPAILVGSLAIAALGAALIPAALAFNIFSDALAGLSRFLPILGEFMDGVVGGLVELSSAGPGLLIAGAGILAVSTALIAFGASSAIGGLLSFFGGDPIEKFLELADKSSGLSASAKAIDSIAAALEKLDSDKVEDLGDSLKGVVKELKNLSKLDLGQAAELFSFLGGASIGGGAAPAVGGVYEEKTGKEAMAAARKSGLYDLDKLGKSEIDRDKVKGASKAQLRAIINHDDVSDEDMEFVQTALAEKRSGVKPQAATDAAVGVKTEAMDKASTKSKEIYSKIEGISSTAAANMMSGEGLDEKVELNLVRAMSRSNSYMGKRGGQIRLDRLKASAESGEISPEKLENIIANILITATEKAGKTSKSDVTDLRAIHKETVLNGRNAAEEETKVMATVAAMGQEISPIVKTSDISDGAAASLKTDPVDKGNQQALLAKKFEDTFIKGGATELGVDSVVNGVRSSDSVIMTRDQMADYRNIGSDDHFMGLKEKSDAEKAFRENIRNTTDQEGLKQLHIDGMIAFNAIVDAKNSESKIEAIDVSTGANLDSQQRQVNQMKESEALQASAGGGTTTVVSKGGDSNNVTNTTINSSAHIDRTMELVPAF